MPPRWVSAAILVGWIAATVWLFRQEIWPSLEPGSPPPFTIDLVDEAQQAQKAPIRWSVSQDGVVVLTARTSVEHRVQENDFTLRADYDPRDPGKGKLKMPLDMTLRIKHRNSSYRVTPEGRLLSIDVEIDSLASLLNVEVPFKAHIWGDVRDGTFAPFLDLNLPGKKERALPTVAVSSQGSVVMPLHPVNRIAGLKPGQAWRVPMFDPVGDSLAALDGSETQVRFLRAKVRPQTENFERERTTTPCLVIDYQEENTLQEDRLTAETWVSEADGRVLKQVSNLSGNRWVMERDN